MDTQDTQGASHNSKVRPDNVHWTFGGGGGFKPLDVIMSFGVPVIELKYFKFC